MEVQNFFTILGKVKFLSDNDIHTINIKVVENDRDTIVKIYLKDKLYENAKEYLNIDDLVAIKGHIEVKRGMIELVADKLSFLCSRGGN
jgi:hypothetical protein